MIGHIPELLEAGIDSLKIEGRMKTALYVASVARTYRRAIDDYQKDPALYEKTGTGICPRWPAVPSARTGPDFSSGGRMKRDSFTTGALT